MVHDLHRKTPRTWREMVQLARQVTENSPDTYIDFDLVLQMQEILAGQPTLSHT
jgi:hypothetical protein